MNRALPLIVMVAVLGGGLAFLALKTSPAGPIPDLSDPAEPIAVPMDSKPRTAKSADTESTTLAAVGDMERATVAVGGTARYWEIIPMNARGQRIDEAKVTATPAESLGASALEGSGRTKWTAVPAGRWNLKVEVKDQPTWVRNVVLAPNGPKRTAVYVGEELRISGEVRDSNGAPLPRNTPVFILPKGAPHPTQEQLRRNAKAGNETSARGAIAVQTDAGGRFKTRLPKAGEYRISIGNHRGNDKARWTQKADVELTHGGPDHIVATVPARAELTVRVSGRKEDRPTAVSAYVFDADRAAQMALQTQSGADDSGASMSLEDAQRQAKKEAIKRGKAGKRGGANRGQQDGGGDSQARGGTARTMTEENQKMQELDFAGMAEGRGAAARAPLFEPGWRSIGTQNVNAEGEVVFNDLPPSKDLRFLFVRGTERIATQAPVRMRKEQRAIGKVMLPPPSLEDGFQQNSLATIQLSDRPDDPESPTLETGAVWTIAGQ
ncbi:MAG: hypothetical protein ACJAZN_001893 [Planctomycetota bacterium]|jgi:hypothetical protein